MQFKTLSSKFKSLSIGEKSVMKSVLIILKSQSLEYNSISQSISRFTPQRMSTSRDIPGSPAGDVNMEPVNCYPPRPSEEAMSVSVIARFMRRWVLIQNLCTSIRLARSKPQLVLISIATYTSFSLITVAGRAGQTLRTYENTS
jgi:hypothetical protein